MFGIKIRSWMEAHIPRSRSKKKDKRNELFQQQQQLYQQQLQQQQQQVQQQYFQGQRQQYQLQQHHFSYDPEADKVYNNGVRRRNDFIEVSRITLYVVIAFSFISFFLLSFVLCRINCTY